MRFQFTLPRGERPPWSAFWNSLLLFQFTLPRGERRGPIRRGSRARTYFNSRSHAGSDLVSVVFVDASTRFQFTLPRGERLVQNSLAFEPSLFQFTLPRGERQTADCNHLSVTLISIHAPTRGATAGPGVCAVRLPISIHAPTRGATAFAMLFSMVRNFNSRSHAGSDFRSKSATRLAMEFQFTLPRGERQEGACRLGWACSISIHAPTRGATSTTGLRRLLVS